VPVDAVAQLPAAARPPAGRPVATPQGERSNATATRPALAAPTPLRAASTSPARAPLRAELGRLLGALAIPRFLQRDRAA
jgi:hypothetical protein